MEPLNSKNPILDLTPEHIISWISQYQKKNSEFNLGSTLTSSLDFPLQNREKTINQIINCLNRHFSATGAQSRKDHPIPVCSGFYLLFFFN